MCGISIIIFSTTTPTTATPTTTPDGHFRNLAWKKVG
jgi:hypothetical protein